MSDTTTDDLPELVPQKLSDEIEVVLLVTARDREGSVFVTGFTHSNSGGSPEEQARSRLTNYDGDHQRFAGLMKVKIPRSLLVERWKVADK